MCFFTWYEYVLVTNDELAFMGMCFVMYLTLGATGIYLVGLIIIESAKVTIKSIKESWNYVYRKSEESSSSSFEED